MRSYHLYIPVSKPTQTQRLKDGDLKRNIMNLYIIPGALAVTIVVMFIASLFSKRPVRALWVFGLIVYLAVWASQLWMMPVGPAFWGISWLPMFLVAGVFWFLIVLLIRDTPKPIDTGTEIEKAPVLIVGLVFWIVVFLLITAIAVGYYQLYEIARGAG